jgi:hypothetical protein
MTAASESAPLAIYTLQHWPGSALLLQDACRLAAGSTVAARSGGPAHQRAAQLTPDVRDDGALPRPADPVVQRRSAVSSPATSYAVVWRVTPGPAAAAAGGGGGGWPQTSRASGPGRVAPAPAAEAAGDGGGGGVGVRRH